MRSSSARTYEDRAYEKFTSKTEFIADKLWELVYRTTARFEDIPKQNPLPNVMDSFEWRQVLALLEHRKDKDAARDVERRANGRESFGAKAMRKELGYVLRNYQHADIRRLEQDAAVLRTAAENYTAIADALEAGMRAQGEENHD